MPPILDRIAIVVLACVTALGSAALLLVASRYGVRTSTAATVNYLLALLLITYGVFFLRRGGAPRVGAALLASVTIPGLIAAEVIIEYADWRRVARVRERVAEWNGIPLDQRSAAQIVQQARADRQDLVPSVLPRILMDHASGLDEAPEAFRRDLLPLAGVSHRMTLMLCNEDGRYPRYRSDRLGFNNPDRVWDEGNPALALIGDSFTHGYCVPPDSNLASALRRRWPRTVSLGSGGSGPLVELATLTEYAVPLGAPVVIWLYYENDLDDLAREASVPILRRYLGTDGSQGLVGRTVEMDSVSLEWLERAYHGPDPSDPLIERPALRRAIRLRGLRSAASAAMRRPTSDAAAQVPVLTEILGIARDRVRAEGGELVFVFLPDWVRVTGLAARKGDNWRSEVLAAARGLGLPVIDLLPTFEGAGDLEPLFAKGLIAPAHYSARGYSLVAEAIASSLDSLGIGATIDRAHGPDRPSRIPFP